MHLPVAFIQNIGVPEILILLLIALLLFGAKRVPELARSIGQGMREFKNSVSGITEDTSKDEDSQGTSQSKS